MRKEVTIELPGMTLTAYGRSDWNGGKPRMYVTGDGAFSVIESLENRRRRPYNVWKKIIRRSELGSVIDISTLQWSQYAGCPCPCSPGFILPSQRLILNDVDFGFSYDLWLTIHDAPMVNPAKAPRLLVTA